MHVGIGDKKSKTEAMFIPASCGKNDTPIIPPTIHLPDQSHVHFTDQFKYLGAIITNTLSDKDEILARLKKARCQMGALSNFFKSNCDFQTKLRIFLAIPLNTALYGCESWNLNTDLKKKLSTFFHSSLRSLMGIRMKHVREHSIRNEHLRNSLQIPDILETMRQRQFRALGNFARLPLRRLPRRFVTAWVGEARTSGRPANTLRNTLNDTIGLVLSEPIALNGSRTRDWLGLAKNKTNWNVYADGFLERCKAKSVLVHDYNDFLPPNPYNNLLSQHTP